MARVTSARWWTGHRKLPARLHQRHGTQGAAAVGGGSSGQDAGTPGVATQGRPS